MKESIKLLKEFKSSPLRKPLENCQYGVVLEYDEPMHSCIYICHRDLVSSNFMGYSRPLTHKAIFSFKQELDGLESNQAYYEWLYNESPWKDIFLTKKEEVDELGFALISLDYPVELVLGGCIAQRVPREKLSKIKMWDCAVSYGMNKNKAFLLTYHFGMDDKITVEGPDAHFPFRWLSKSIAKNFISGKYNDRPTMRERLRVESCNLIFSDDPEESKLGSGYFTKHLDGCEKLENKDCFGNYTGTYEKSCIPILDKLL